MIAESSGSEQELFQKVDDNQEFEKLINLGKKEEVEQESEEDYQYDDFEDDLPSKSKEESKRESSLLYE